jgi:hypothetical protein
MINIVNVDNKLDEVRGDTVTIHIERMGEHFWWLSIQERDEERTVIELSSITEIYARVKTERIK